MESRDRTPRAIKIPAGRHSTPWPAQHGQEITSLNYTKVVNIRPLLTYKTGRVPRLTLVAPTENHVHVHSFSPGRRQGPGPCRDPHGSP